MDLEAKSMWAIEEQLWNEVVDSDIIALDVGNLQSVARERELSMGDN